MAKSNRCWLWRTGVKTTLYVQVADDTDDIEQVVFKWTGNQTPIASLRSTKEVLTDCHLMSFDDKGCLVDIGGTNIQFEWEMPTQERDGLIAEGSPPEHKTTTWAQRRSR
jgi:hypothetical protein